MALAGRELILGVTGSIAAYKAAYLLRELTARGGRRHGRDDGARPRVRGAAHVPDALRPAGAHRPVRPAGARGGGARGARRARRRCSSSRRPPRTRWPAPRSGWPTTSWARSCSRCAARCCSPPRWTAACGSTPRCRPTSATLRGRGVDRARAGRGRARVRPHAARAGCPRSRTIVEAAERLLWPRRDLAGEHVLVTAGPTREPIDPVRYLTNRSSGRMGYAIAAQAVRRGAAGDARHGADRTSRRRPAPRDPGADRARDARRGAPRRRDARRS